MRKIYIHMHFFLTHRCRIYCCMDAHDFFPTFYYENVQNIGKLKDLYIEHPYTYHLNYPISIVTLPNHCLAICWSILLSLMHFKVNCKRLYISPHVSIYIIRVQQFFFFFPLKVDNFLICQGKGFRKPFLCLKELSIGECSTA